MRTFPEEVKQEKYYKIIRQVLSKDYLPIKIVAFSCKEDFKLEVSEIECRVEVNADNSIILGTGVGVIDALFSGLMERFSNQFVSLQDFRFEDFSANAKFRGNMSSVQTDAPIEITLMLSNDNRKLFFRKQSRSLVTAAAYATCEAVEFLINAELAVKRLHEDIKHAQNRNRTDLINKYVLQLSELVNIVSYEGVIA